MPPRALLNPPVPTNLSSSSCSQYQSEESSTNSFRRASLSEIAHSASSRLGASRAMADASWGSAAPAGFLDLSMRPFTAWLRLAKGTPIALGQLSAAPRNALQVDEE